MTRTAREVLLHLLVLAILVVALFPIFWMVLSSFKPMSEFFVRTPRVFASEYTLDNYRQVFTLRSFPRNLFNSVLVGTATSATAVPLGFLAAYAVVRYRFAGKSLFLAFLLILQMIPAVVLISPLARVVRFFQAYDTYHAIVFIEMGFAIPICSIVFIEMGFAIPICTWLLIGFIKESCPRELDESAMIDGCGTLGILMRIVLPLARAGVVTVFLFVFLLSWESLMIPLTFLGSRSMQTVPLVIASLHGQGPGGSPPWDTLMAMAVVYSLPVILMAFVLQQHFVKGLISGAVKF